MSTFVSNEQLIAIQKEQIESLEKQLADIKYLNADEVKRILGRYIINSYYEDYVDEDDIVQAICKLAIDIDRDKIIKVLMKYYNLNYGNLTVIGIKTISDEIIKAIRGEE